MIDDPSEIFQPTKIGGRSNVILACNSLRGYKFSLPQKNWLLNGIDGKLDDDEKWTNLNLRTNADVARMYNISTSTMSNWRANIKAGKPLFETKGNHTALSERAKRNVQEKCQELREAGNPPGINKLSELYHEGRKETHLERGGGAAIHA